MKKTFFTLLLLLAATTMNAQNVKGDLNGDGKLTIADITMLVDMVLNYDGHSYVDLGLPSGTLWATCNVGADNPEDYGYYFSWGETDPKETYVWSTYKWCEGSSTTMTKYCNKSDFGYNGYTDDNTVLDFEDDAAYTNWGADWRMPTIGQLDELREKCTWTWTALNGVNGFKVKGPNNNTIFLPAAGYRYDNMLCLKGSCGTYWSRGLGNEPDEAYILFFEDDIDAIANPRSMGFSVRPVRNNGLLQDVLVTDLTLNHSTIEMFSGSTAQLSLTVTPIDADNPSVVWSSSDESIATVNQNGLVTSVFEGTCTITATALDGSGVSATCQVTVTHDPNDYVDLGLTSGTKWATCNVGAHNPYEYGDYFAWGETSAKDTYSWSTYKWCKGSENTLTKYCNNSSYGYNGYTDDNTVLDFEDDAAYVKWGSAWRMPTIDQLDELREECTWTWTTSGVNGFVVKSKTNTNSIFLPAAGYRYDSRLGFEGLCVTYWSRSLGDDPDGAFILYFEDIIDVIAHPRWLGFSVRPVRAQ